MFADTRGAFAKLDDRKKLELERLEAVCSLAHHDKKINSYSPGYPVLTPEQRAANPPNRVPVVLKHPVTGKILGAEPEILGELTVKEVYENFSKATVDKKNGVKVYDRVIAK